MHNTLKPGELSAEDIRHFEVQCCVCLTITSYTYRMNGHNISFCQLHPDWVKTTQGWCCPECAKTLK